MVMSILGIFIAVIIVIVVIVLFVVVGVAANETIQHETGQSVIICLLSAFVISYCDVESAVNLLKLG